MITGAQPKILLTQDEDGTLKMDDEMGKLLFGETENNWKLVRERDGLTKESIFKVPSSSWVSNILGCAPVIID